jgi:hypothetical protein
MLDEISFRYGLLHSVSCCPDQPNILFCNKASYIFIYGNWLHPLDTDLYWLLPEKNQEAVHIRASISWDKPFSDIVFRKFPVYWKSQDVAIIAVASVLVFYRIVPSLTLLQVYLSVAPSYVVNFNVLLLLTLLMLDEISFREWFTAFC